MKPNPLETLKIYNFDAKELTLQEIAEDLEKIGEIKKCSFCGCNADTLREFATVARKQGEQDLAERATILRNEINQKKRYDCIGCAPCYPADISNLLFEVNNPLSEVRQPGPCGCSSSCSTEKSTRWPVEKGECFVGDESSPIAVCTIASTKLPKQLHTKFADKIAIVGYCETENIGIEKVIKNIISNSHIRYLILCGEESGLEMMGHLAGQAILSLHENGINEKGMIIGAKGKRPVLKNVDSEQVKQFQSQIELFNLVGSVSMDEIENAIHICLSKQTPQFERKSASVIINKLITAQNPERLVLDKRGFFIILPQKEENKIYVEYYANSGKLLHTIVGTDAPSIYYTIIEKGFVSKLDHAAYLGKELTRAEYSLKHDEPYMQDKALGEMKVEQST